MASVQFVIPGRPATKGSVRFTRGNYAKPDNPRLESWTAVARFEAREAMAGQQPWQEAVSLTVYFCWDRPRGHHRKDGSLREDAPQYPSSRADVDKCLRALLDAMIGSVVVDDGQVVEVTAYKQWALRDETRVEVKFL